RIVDCSAHLVKPFDTSGKSAPRVDHCESPRKAPPWRRPEDRAIAFALSRTRPHGSRRAASGAPHHEGLGFRREKRPHPEEPAKGGRLEGWAERNPPTCF